MSNPLISVVMNCYNGEKYLREAIDSVCQQTYTNWELVFWDNQSKDRSAEIVRSYADPRIRYLLAPEHTTLGGGRRRAVNECRGEFISFLDTDDLYLPENLARKLEFIEREEAGMVYGGVIYTNEAGEERRRRLPHHRSGMVLRGMLQQFETDTSTMMIRRSALEARKLNFDDRIQGSEEFDLLAQLAVTERCSVVPEYLAKLRHSRSSLTYAVMEKWAPDRLLTLSKIVQQHPNIEAQYPTAFREARARAEYYRARWLVDAGRPGEALAVIRTVKSAGWRYLCLHLALRISPACWNLVHRFLPSSRML